MDLSKKATLNILASYAGRIAGTILALISIGLITRALGREGFGEYSTIIAYLGTAQILADLGLYSLLTREISQNPERESYLLSQFFTLRLIAAAFFLAVAAALVFIFPYSAGVKAGIVMSAGAFLSLSLAQILASVFQKYVQVYKAAIAEFVGRAIQLGVVAFFFITNPGLFGFLAGLVAGSIAIFVINVFFAYRLVPFRLAASVPQWRQILKTTLPIAASIVFTLLYFRADTIMLSVMRTQEEVGIYNVAYKVLESLIFFPAVFVGLMLPVMSRYAQESRKQFAQLLGRLTNTITIFTLPAVVGGVLLAASIVNIIGGSQFLAATTTLQILFIAIGVIAYGTLFGSAVIALNLQKKAMWVYFAGFVVNFISNLIVIPRYTYIGAAWTTAATEILVTIFLAVLVWRAVHFTPSLLVAIKSALGAAFMGAGIWFLARPVGTPLVIVKLLPLVVVSAGLYFLLLRLFDAFVLSRRRQ